MNSKILIKTAVINNKTRYEDIYFEAPYKLIPPFYNKDEAEVMILSASAGVLKGDFVDLEIHCGKNSNTKITSQGYEKIFNTGDGFCEKKLSIKAEEGARICYLPQPTILYENSNFLNTSNVEVEENSVLVFSDIFSIGRVYMGEMHQMKKICNRLSIRIGNKLVVRENMVIDPAKLDYSKMGIFEGYTHTGFLFIYSLNSEKIKNYIVENITDKMLIGVTSLRKGISVRMLGKSGDEIYELFKTLASMS